MRAVSLFAALLTAAAPADVIAGAATSTSVAASDTSLGAADLERIVARLRSDDVEVRRAAVRALLDAEPASAPALRARLFRAGVQVTTVKPGFIDTAMTFGMKSGPLMASPEACARACLRHARRGREVAYYPPVWRLIMLIIKHIPEPLMKRMSF